MLSSGVAGAALVMNHSYRYYELLVCVCVCACVCACVSAVVLCCAVLAAALFVSCARRLRTRLLRVGLGRL